MTAIIGPSWKPLITVALLGQTAAQAPQQAGTVYWPVRQICAEGRRDWVEVPTAGQKLTDLKSPAAAPEILPTGGAAAHAH